jgi:hypothetical protein
LRGEEDEVESPSRLTLDLKPVKRVITDQAKDGYQVKFYQLITYLSFREL